MRYKGILSRGSINVEEFFGKKSGLDPERFVFA